MSHEGITITSGVRGMSLSVSRSLSHDGITITSDVREITLLIPEA
jgi:hypothetical protein